MSRIVAALYNTRAEAETAQARLRTQLRTADVEILSQHDRASLSKFRFSPDDEKQYERALTGGDYLLCAKVPPAGDTAHIVRTLEGSSSVAQDAQSAAVTGQAPELQNSERSDAMPNTALFVGDAWIARGGAEVTYLGPDGTRQHVTRSAYEPTATRRFDEGELNSAGLLQERTVEASEMSEVPVIGRRAVVREEVVIRKTAEEQTETIRDTVRRTKAEVTDIDPGTSGATISRPGKR